MIYTDDHALSHALQFLEKHFHANGCWIDFPSQTFGSSTTWVTGYTGYCLSNGASANTGLLDRACTFVAAHRNGPGWGWGLTDIRVPADADSTSWCALFLAACNRLPADQAQMIAAFLLEHRRSDGGFATFADPEQLRQVPSWRTVPSFAGWCSSHVSVTAAVVQALLQLGNGHYREVYARALAFFAAHRAPSGLWHDYWWQGPYYPTYQVARAVVLLAPTLTAGFHLEQTYQAIRARQHTPGYWSCADDDGACAFSTALAVQTLLLDPDWQRHAAAIDGACAWLLEAQSDDGSWAAPPILRVPRPEEVDPHQNPDHPAYAQHAFVRPAIHRVFTTATVYATLTKAQRAIREPGAAREVGALL